jgi:hypothetical protein
MPDTEKGKQEKAAESPSPSGATGPGGASAHAQSAQSAAHHGGDVRPHQQKMRQNQVNHFKAIMDECSNILNDPNSAQVLKDEAQDTYDEMVAKISAYQSKYGVTPQS